MKIALKFEQARELSTGSINVRQIEVRPMEDAERETPEDIIQPPTDTAELLEEVELLAALPKDQEIDITPEIKEAEYALQMQQPAAKGDPTAVAMELSSSLEMDADLPELGREPAVLKPAEIGQATVDPGAVDMDDGDLGKFTEDLLKRGANGNVEQGALDGIASLDDLLDLPSNILLSKKTMLPSDLLFEFNKAELRESAKVGLMKLALLMDRNPELYCWIEGHTDLVGGDEFNLELSTRRAEAVKSYLVNSLRMDASRILTRGFGRFEPIVTTGTREEQAINRRVEIRMRKNPPNSEQLKITPKKAAVVEETPAPKAVLVKPKRALPIEMVEPAPPRATPVPPPAPADPPPLRAQPVTE